MHSWGAQHVDDTSRVMLVVKRKARQKNELPPNLNPS